MSASERCISYVNSPTQEAGKFRNTHGNDSDSFHSQGDDEADRPGAFRFGGGDENLDTVATSSVISHSIKPFGQISRQRSGQLGDSVPTVALQAQTVEQYYTEEEVQQMQRQIQDMQR